MGETKKKISVRAVLKDAFQLYFEHFIVLIGITLLVVVPTILWTQFGNSVFESLPKDLDVRVTRVLKTAVSFLFYVLDTVVLATTLVYLNDAVAKKRSIQSKKNLFQAVRKVFWKVLGVQILIYFCINITATISSTVSLVFPKNIAIYSAFILTIVAALVIEALFFLAPLWAVRNAPIIDSMNGSLKMIKGVFLKVLVLMVFLYLLRWLINDSLDFTAGEFAKSFPSWDGKLLFAHANTIIESLIEPYRAAMIVIVVGMLPSPFKMKK